MTAKGFLEIPVRDDAREFSTFERGPNVLRALGGLGLSVERKRVVDLGAGYGSLSIACLKAGATDVLAVDIHPERLDAIAARGRAAGVEVRTRRANLLDPWATTEAADIAFLIGVVEYAGLWSLAANVADLQRSVFGAAYDALKPGGRLVFGSKNRLWPRFVFKDVNTGQPLVNVLPRRAADRLSRRLSGKPYRDHIHSPRGWAQLMETAGFEDVQTYVPYLSYQFPLEIVRAASFGDIPRVRRIPATTEERRVAWGRLGVVKAVVMAAAGTAGIQMGHSTIAIASKPLAE